MPRKRGSRAFADADTERAYAEATAVKSRPVLLLTLGCLVVLLTLYLIAVHKTDISSVLINVVVWGTPTGCALCLFLFTKTNAGRRHQASITMAAVFIFFSLLVACGIEDMANSAPGKMVDPVTRRPIPACATKLTASNTTAAAKQELPPPEDLDYASNDLNSTNSVTLSSGNNINDLWWTRRACYIVNAEGADAKSGHPVWHSRRCKPLPLYKPRSTAKAPTLR